MRRGRPSTGVALIDHLAAPRLVRRRVRIVLATLAGQLTITEACAQLGVRRTRFFALRYQILHGALAAITARPRGRPRRASGGLGADPRSQSADPRTGTDAAGDAAPQ